MPISLPPPERAIVQAFNAQRAVHGLPALRLNRRLSRTAERHSRDLIRHDRLSHTSTDGTSLARRIARAGSFRLKGEVLAFAPNGSGARARAVVRLFMRSPPHRAQLLNPRYRVLGVGRVRGGMRGARGVVVTVDLAAR